MAKTPSHMGGLPIGSGSEKICTGPMPGEPYTDLSVKGPKASIYSKNQPPGKEFLCPGITDQPARVGIVFRDGGSRRGK